MRRQHTLLDGNGAIGIALAFLTLLAVAGLFDRTAWVILAVDGAMSLVALLAYRADKRAAQRGSTRTRESALHLLALLGGWPGALVAQVRYRHKTRKQPFRAIFWLTVVSNLGITVWVLTMSGTAITS